MFTGIVQACCEVVDVLPQGKNCRLRIALSAELRQGLAIGASVAVNGGCLTVVQLDTDAVCFDVISETLALTNLNDLAPGLRQVNIERSAQQSSEIGGHIVSGHVDGQAEVLSLKRNDEHVLLQLQLPENLIKYVFLRGFIAINGCSLTVAECEPSGVIAISLIPETLRMTNINALNEGDLVNIEIDRQTQVIVDTVERVLAARDAQ